MPSILAVLSKRFEDARAEYHDHVANVKSGYRDVFGRKTPQGRAEDRERRLKARTAMTDEERKKAKRRHARHHHRKRKTKSGETVATGSSSQPPMLDAKDEQSPVATTDTSGDGQTAGEPAALAVEEDRRHTAEDGDQAALLRKYNAPKSNQSTDQLVDDSSAGPTAEETTKDDRVSIGKRALLESEDSHTNTAAAYIRLDSARGKDERFAKDTDPDTKDQRVDKPTDDSSTGSAVEEIVKDDEALAETGALAENSETDTDGLAAETQKEPEISQVNLGVTETLARE